MVVRGIIAFLLLGLVFFLCFVLGTLVHVTINIVTNYKFEQPVNIIASAAAGLATGWLGKLVLNRFMTPYPGQAVVGVFVGLCLLSAAGAAATLSTSAGGYQIVELVTYLTAAISVFYFLWPSKTAAAAS